MLIASDAASAPRSADRLMKWGSSNEAPARATLTRSDGAFAAIRSCLLALAAHTASALASHVETEHMNRS